ncbi:MAG: hypothetical protein ATN35_08505 [Epulopiscium sp. Nele67-Bin004]|nr:MAG: hypothetical protein ATN35_08505 [Epulopiscium sp. Nele67-Bin004]
MAQTKSASNNNTKLNNKVNLRKSTSTINTTRAKAINQNVEPPSLEEQIEEVATIITLTIFEHLATLKEPTQNYHNLNKWYEDNINQYLTACTKNIKTITRNNEIKFDLTMQFSMAEIEYHDTPHFITAERYRCLSYTLLNYNLIPTMQPVIGICNTYNIIQTSKQTNIAVLYAVLQKAGIDLL